MLVRLSDGVNVCVVLCHLWPKLSRNVTLPLKRHSTLLRSSLSNAHLSCFYYGCLLPSPTPTNINAHPLECNAVSGISSHTRPCTSALESGDNLRFQLFVFAVSSIHKPLILSVTLVCTLQVNYPNYANTLWDSFAKLLSNYFCSDWPLVPKRSVKVNKLLSSSRLCVHKMSLHSKTLSSNYHWKQVVASDYSITTNFGGNTAGSWWMLEEAGEDIKRIPYRTLSCFQIVFYLLMIWWSFILSQ